MGNNVCLCVNNECTRANSICLLPEKMCLLRRESQLLHLHAEVPPGRGRVGAVCSAGTCARAEGPPGQERAPGAEPTAPGEGAGTGEGRAAGSDTRAPASSKVRPLWIPAPSHAKHNRSQKPASRKYLRGPDHQPQSQVRPASSVGDRGRS